MLKRTLLVDNAIRALFIAVGITMTVFWLPPNFDLNKDSEYILSFTQFDLYSKYTVVILLLHSFLMLGIARHYKRKYPSDEVDESYVTIYKNCLFPNLIIITVFVIIHEIVKPAVNVVTGFNLSGHIMRRAVSNGVLIRNTFWMNSYKSVYHFEIRLIIYITTALALLYSYYENLCTALYFHTPGELLVGFVLGLATAWVELDYKVATSSRKKIAPEFLFPKDDYTIEFKAVNANYVDPSKELGDLENDIRTTEMEDASHEHSRLKLT
jgi:hypothetical protein